jgi:hypothetical protein
LKLRLRKELHVQAQRRLPATYASLATRIAPDASGDGIVSALERLMEEDAMARRPLLAALAVETLVTGLPAAWFFKKAASLGLLVGDPLKLDAYAFHARELQRAIRFYAGPRGGRLGHDENLAG